MMLIQMTLNKHFCMYLVFVFCICTVYNNIESTVINNDNTSKYFKLERSIRLGCPLSPYWLIMANKILANKVRSDYTIRGIIINNKEIKICLLADDATWILSDLLTLTCTNFAQDIPALLKIKNRHWKYNLNI